MIQNIQPTTEIYLDEGSRAVLARIQKATRLYDRAVNDKFAAQDSLDTAIETCAPYAKNAEELCAFVQHIADRAHELDMRAFRIHMMLRTMRTSIGLPYYEIASIA